MLWVRSSASRVTPYGTRPSEASRVASKLKRCKHMQIHTTLPAGHRRATLVLPETCTSPGLLDQSIVHVSIADTQGTSAEMVFTWMTSTARRVCRENQVQLLHGTRNLSVGNQEPRLSTGHQRLLGSRSFSSSSSLRVFLCARVHNEAAELTRASCLVPFVLN